MPSWSRTLPHLLKPAGYRSYHSGKWHVNNVPDPEKDGCFDKSWGFNIARQIVHKREQLIWKPVPRYSGVESVYKVGQAGELTGLRNLEQGKGFVLLDKQAEVKLQDPSGVANHDELKERKRNLWTD